MFYTLIWVGTHTHTHTHTHTCTHIYSLNGMLISVYLVICKFYLDFIKLGHYTWVPYLCLSWTNPSHMGPVALTHMKTAVRLRPSQSKMLKVKKQDTGMK
jgi:hypothetical protein